MGYPRVFRIVPEPRTQEEKRELLSQTLADFRISLTVLVNTHSALFRRNGGGGTVHDMLSNVREAQLSENSHSTEQTTEIVSQFVFLSFDFCCQCVFDISVTRDVFHYDEDFMNDFIPKEPFLGQFRELFYTDKNFKAKWMHIITSAWKFIQYVDMADVVPTTSFFMHFYPGHETLHEISEFVSTHESQKKELQARRRDVLRHLAHLHHATVGRYHPSPIVSQHHVHPEEPVPSNKRKLEYMTTLLDRWVIAQ
jgi:hypothetical protein